MYQVCLEKMVSRRHSLSDLLPQATWASPVALERRLFCNRCKCFELSSYLSDVHAGGYECSPSLISGMSLRRQVTEHADSHSSRV